MRQQDKNQGKRKKREAGRRKAKRLRTATAERAGRSSSSSFGDAKAMAEAGNPQARSCSASCPGTAGGTAQDYGQTAFWRQKAADGATVNAYTTLALLSQSRIRQRR